MRNKVKFFTAVLSIIISSQTLANICSITDDRGACVSEFKVDGITIGPTDGRDRGNAITVLVSDPFNPANSGTFFAYSQAELDNTKDPTYSLSYNLHL